nr:MAG TPA_asm: hypothetical protein [Bacteriophage sp.]
MFTISKHFLYDILYPYHIINICVCLCVFSS